MLWNQHETFLLIIISVMILYVVGLNLILTWAISPHTEKDYIQRKGWISDNPPHQDDKRTSNAAYSTHYRIFRIEE